MSSKHKEVQTLGTFCQNRSSFKTKIALLTYYKLRFSNWTEILILLIEYLQLMSQVILSPESNFNKPSFNSYLVEVLVYFFKIINPSYLLSYGNSDSYTSTVLVVLVLSTILKFILFGYIICVSRGKFRTYEFLIFVWRWVFKLQARVFYFLFSSFWVRTIIQANEDDFTIFGMNPASLISIATLMLIMEFSFSLILETQFCYVLPTQNLLCAKNNELQITTLVQKLIIQMIPMIFITTSSTTPWIYAIFGIVMSLIRDYQFLNKLPLYQFKALMLQRALLSMVLALNITYFLNTILDTKSFKGANINFIVITWICISILLVVLAHEVLRNRLLSLLTSNVKSSPEILLHKVIASRELRRKEKRPSPMSDEYDLTHLLATNQNIKIQDVFGLDLNNTVPEALASPHLSWEKLDKVFLQYLEELLAKYPKNSLIRLHTAYISFKNAEPYTKTIKLAVEVEKNKWSENYLSSTLLLYEIEKSILSEHNSQGTEKNLDFYTYIKSKVLVDDLRKKMMDQTDLYLRVCDNILSDISNIGEIHRSGQSISDLKHSIQKKIDSISKILPEYFISPYLICAEYHLIINHSVVSFEKYCEMYAQRYYKSEKFYKEAHLIEENLYQDTNAFLLLSSQKTDAGKILHTNRSLMNICGGTSSKGFLGSHISSIFAPSLRGYYDNLFKQTIRAGDQKLVNKIHRAFIYNKSKYLIEADFCLKYHPYLTQNLCFDMIIRPVPSNREFLLIKEDGDIEGASKEISKLLRLTDFNNSSNRSSLPVRALSEDLFKINTAFNIVHMNGMVEGNHKIFELTKTALNKFKGIQSGSDHHLHHSYTHQTHSPFTTFTPVIKMSQKTAMDIYTAFSTEDQILQLGTYEKGLENTRRKRGGEDDDAYVFYARVEFIHFGNVTMKLVSLRETNSDEDGEGLSKMFSDVEPEKQFFAKKSQFVKFVSSDSKNFSAHKTLQSPMLQSPVLQDLKDEDSNSENHIPEEKDDTQEISTTFRQNAKPVVKRKFVFPLLQKQSTLVETNRQSVMNSDSRGLIDGNMSSFRNGTMSPGLTPLSPGQSDRKNLISPHMKKKLSNFHGEANSASTISDPEMGANNHARDARRKEKVQKYISSHHSSQKSVEKSSNKAFRKAIIKKSYPKSFIVLCLTFYGVILLTFIAQIIMKVVSDSTMKDLQLKKDLLKNSEQRSYKAALIQINAIGAALQIKGALSVGGVLVGVSTVVTNLQIRLQGMQTANDKMVEYAYSLDKDIQKELFKADVQIQGTYLDSGSASGIYKHVNSFQAAQEITNAVKSLKGLPQASSQAGYDMFNYLSNNIMDDFFYKSVQITDLFTSSVEDQKSSYQRIIILCLVLTPAFLAGMGFLLAGIIWNQYRIEQKNLKAFIRIKPGGVKDINDRLEGFKKNLINEETFEDKWFANLGETVDLVPDRTEKSAATYAKKQSTQIIRYREFRQRYMKYIVRVAFYILVLISITIWDLITTQKAIRVIYNYQDQLQYANFISSRVTAGYASYPVLFLSNNTKKVEHMVAYDALLDAAAQIKSIQSEIPKRFLDVEGNYNPDVKSIIYDNNPSCTNIPADALSYCKSLANIGQPVNLIAAAAVYQGILTTKLLDFDNANKTSQSTLLTAAYLNVQTFLPNFYLIASEAQMIADVMDKSLTKKIAETEDNRTVIIIVFSCMLVIVSILIWFHILQVIREVYNDFKKVLQIFPPGLVLSSYLIKKFLKRTSNEPLLIG